MTCAATGPDPAKHRNPFRSPFDDLATAVGILAVAGLVARLRRPVEARLQEVRAHPSATLEGWVDATTQSFARLADRMGMPAGETRPTTEPPAEDRTRTPAA